MSLGPIISNDDLDTYARRKEAENDIADLVRSLVCASLAASACSVRFRSGQGIRLSGFDGVVQSAAGGLQVPQGNSVWELSAREDVKKKANEDYSGRSKEPGEIDPKDTTYVAVTMRKWPAKETWAQDKKKKGLWKEVIALDAGDLSTWLNASPAVAAMFRRQTGLQPLGIEDAEGYLESWLEATGIPLKAELLTIGRAEQSQKVKDWLSGSATSTILKADNIEEAVAFASAVFKSLEADQRQSVLARTVIVRDEEAFRQVVRTKGTNLILIPIFKEFAGSVEAPKKGHHLLIPRDPRAPSSGAEILLSRQPEREIAAFLKQLGIADEKVQRIVSLSHGRTSVIRRILGFVGTPDWADPKMARELIPLLLMGRWNPGISGDVEVIEKDFGIKSVDFEATLLKWKNSPDAPVQQAESGWEWVSRFDSWTHLAVNITESDLKIFSKFSREVLTEFDPSLVLDEGERFLAGIKGLKKKYSYELVDGTSETLALLGNLNSTMTAIRTYRIEDLASGIVRGVLQLDWKSWHTLKGVLPNLAEAAPNIFMTNLEESMKSPEGVTKLFSDKRDAFFGGIPQSGILWALETLAWDPLYLGRACNILLKLQTYDNTANNIGNRPIRSLKEILSSWHPQTLAAPDIRIKMLKSLAKQDSNITWDLIAGFFPRGGDSATSTHPSKWREAIAAAPKPRATMADVAKFANELPAILIELAQTNAERWPDLLEIIEQLPENFQSQILVEIKTASSQFSATLKSKVQDELRDFLNRSRSFPDADWTVKDASLLEQAENLYNDLLPADLLAKHKWLFYGWPKFIDSNEADDFEGHQKKVAHHRTLAMTEILNSNVNPSDFLFFLDNSDQGYWIGLQFSEASGNNKEAFETFLISEDPTISYKRQEFYKIWIYKTYESKGDSWLLQYLESLAQKNNNEAIAFVLGSIPCNPSTWNLAARYGDDVLRRYWEIVPVYYAKEDWASIKPILLSILKSGRVADVARLVSFYATEKLGSKSPPPMEVIEILQLLTDRILSLEEPISDTGMFSYNIGEIFKAIEGKDGISENALTIAEWKLFPILKNSTRRPKNLHRLLEKSPDSFVDLVSFIYRSEIEGEGDSADSLDPMIREARAQQAYSLLDGSWKGFPGVDDTGNLNGEMLLEWVESARKKLEEKHRSDIGELEIGKILARSPAGTDSIWPAEAVRDIIESAPSQTLKRGFYSGVLNGRGSTTRGLGDGGDLERQLVDQYENWARSLALSHPIAASVLMELADAYRSDAKRHDISSERYK